MVGGASRASRTTRPRRGRQDAEGRFTAFLDQSLYQDMDPDRPMVHSLRSARDEDRVVISCLVAEIEYDWRLAPLDDGRGTRIEVTVAVPERRANRFELSGRSSRPRSAGSRASPRPPAD